MQYMYEGEYGISGECVGKWSNSNVESISSNAINCEETTLRTAGGSTFMSVYLCYILLLHKPIREKVLSQFESSKERERD